MFDVDWMGRLAREVLRERLPALIAEACAWSVGLSDRPHHERRRGRLRATGGTNGDRIARGQALSGEEDGRLDLGDARPGSFRDVLNAVDADGVVYADRFDREVIEPFVLATCVLAAERARVTRRAEWGELLDDLGEDGRDLVGVVRAGEWEASLRTEAEHLVLAALADVPLLEVEAEGLPLSLVRAAAARASGACSSSRISAGRSASCTRGWPARPPRCTVRRRRWQPPTCCSTTTSSAPATARRPLRAWRQAAGARIRSAALTGTCPARSGRGAAGTGSGVPANGGSGGNTPNHSGAKRIRAGVATVVSRRWTRPAAQAAASGAGQCTP